MPNAHRLLLGLVLAASACTDPDGDNGTAAEEEDGSGSDGEGDSAVGDSGETGSEPANCDQAWLTVTDRRRGGWATPWDNPAQSIVVEQTTVLETVDVSAHVGPYTGTIALQLRDDVDGLPGETELGQAARAGSSWSGPIRETWIRFTFDSPVTLVPGTTYWLRMFASPDEPVIYDEFAWWWDKPSEEDGVVATGSSSTKVYGASPPEIDAQFEYGLNCD